MGRLSGCIHVLHCIRNPSKRPRGGNGVITAHPTMGWTQTHWPLKKLFETLARCFRHTACNSFHQGFSSSWRGPRTGSQNVLTRVIEKKNNFNSSVSVSRLNKNPGSCWERQLHTTCLHVAFHNECVLVVSLPQYVAQATKALFYT